MTANELFTIIAQISGLLGIVCSMLAMGLGLTLAQIVPAVEKCSPGGTGTAGELRAGASARLRYHMGHPARRTAKNRVDLLGHLCRSAVPCIGGERRQGQYGYCGWGDDPPDTVVTIFYLPVVLPLLLTGVEVDAGAIAQSLIVLMLIPLILGLLIKAHSPDTAKDWAPTMNKIGALEIVILLVVGLGLNLSNVISLIGTGGFLALLLFIVGSLLIGFVVGGRDTGVRNVMGLGTAQRNVSAAILITLQNFSGTTAVPYVLVAADPHPTDLTTARTLAGQPR